ncbi:MAG: NAD(+) kinase [Acidobacteria bacterium]|nr:MAG: NAD(+) kinase [Acidobacteriota bacterium]
MNVRNVVIVTKPKQPEVARVAGELVQWFRARNVMASLELQAASTADLAVVLGGDGTLLAAARVLGDRQVPIVAINYGGLGFLTEVTLSEMYPSLEVVLAGKFVTEQRMMMDLHVSRADKRLADYRALNDVVINKGTLSRMIELEARVDGQYVSRFRADGLIVSTPTGSTAYNISAGGPIIFPTMSAMVVTPICSHTLTNRPIVLPEHVQIAIMLRSAQDDVYITVDGQVGLKLQMGDHIVVVKSDVSVKLVAPADKNYFDVLRGKLKWG